MATHSNILAWIIPWTGKSASYSPWGHKESDVTENIYSTRRRPNTMLETEDCFLSV